MKIKIDRDLCEANAVCLDYAPKVFTLDDNDELHVTEAELTEANRAAIAQAVKHCPRGALSADE